MTDDPLPGDGPARVAGVPLPPGQRIYGHGEAGSVGELARRLVGNPVWHFWWD